MKFNTLFITAALLLATACQEMRQTEDEAANSQALAFAQAYFNLDFERAARLATPESRKWLSFAASNLEQRDLDLWNAQAEPAVAEIGGTTEWVDDTTRTVAITVKDFLQLDTIGQEANMVDEAAFRLTTVKREGKWLVRMASLPRSERRSRD